MYSTDHICQHLAKALSEPQAVYDFINSSLRSGDFDSEKWFDGTLSEGILGIITFFAVMDHHFTNEGWDEVAAIWMNLAIRKVEVEGYNNISLQTGLAGLCFATFLSSREKNRYVELLEKLETRLIDEIDHSWSRPLDRACELSEPLLPSYYNLMHGIAGVIGYLLLRKEDPRIMRCLKSCIEQLCQAFTKPGFFDQGNFILSMPYGITGSLSALSLALKENIDTPSLKETIALLADWLSKQHHNLQWPPIITLPSSQGASDVGIELNKDTWAFGAPAVARSLFLAADATHNEELKNFSQEAFLQIFSRSESDWNQMASSFAMGKAGVLATTYFMLKDLKDDSLKEKILFFEERIKSFYSPHHHFGFRLVDVTQDGRYRWVDHPGLLEGAVGVALSLLLLQNRSNLPWERAFLIN